MTMLTTLRRAAAVVAVALIGLVAATPLRAEVIIDVTRGNMRPLPIAIADMFGAGPAEAQYGKDIARVVAADLERSGLFKPIDQRAFIQTPASMQTNVRFADWKQINAEALVQGSVGMTPDGRLRVEFHLWDVFSETEIGGTGMAFSASPQTWRRMAHLIADAVYKRITGEDGYFDTQIVYISESGPKNDRKKRLAIMDQDGENHKFLSDGSDIVLTPRFSPTAREITYMSYYRGTPRVYIYQIDTGRREQLGDFPGMTFAPRFSPDGNKVIMSLAQDGNTEIYEMNLMT
ncbi:MAG TPA: Tol-Pal system protein TolB, partial [Phycisphaerae bacterium]|nr:Tol-Pal system protein TolB [Phycisphaerae bacterium]